MSTYLINALNKAIKAKQLKFTTPSQLAVFRFYLDRANDHGGSVYPSNGYVAEMTGYTDRTVRTVKRWLEAQGLIQEVGEYRRMIKSYQIDISKLGIQSRKSDPELDIRSRKSDPTNHQEVNHQGKLKEEQAKEKEKGNRALDLTKEQKTNSELVARLRKRDVYDGLIRKLFKKYSPEKISHDTGCLEEEIRAGAKIRTFGGALKARLARTSKIKHENAPKVQQEGLQEEKKNNQSNCIDPEENSRIQQQREQELYGTQEVPAEQVQPYLAKLRAACQ